MNLIRFDDRSESNFFLYFKCAHTSMILSLGLRVVFSPSTLCTHFFLSAADEARCAAQKFISFSFSFVRLLFVISSLFVSVHSSFIYKHKHFLHVHTPASVMSVHVFGFCVSLFFALFVCV